MAGPFSTVCPGCDAKLKLKAAPPVGKKIRCPKCEEVFAPVTEEAEETYPWDLPDESSMPSASSRSGDDDENDEADQGYTPPYKARGTGKSSSSSSRPRRSASSRQFPTGLVLGGGAVVAVLILLVMLAGPVMTAIKKAMVPNVDPGYFLVHDNGLVVDLSPPAFLALPGVPPGWSVGPDVDEINKELDNDLGVKLADISSIQIALTFPAAGAGAAAPAMPQPGEMPAMPPMPPGTELPTAPNIPQPTMPAAPMGEPKVRIVLRLNKPPRVHPAHRSKLIEGIRCYSSTEEGAGDTWFCRGTDNTLLMGEEAEIQASLAAFSRKEPIPVQPPAPGHPVALHLSPGLLKQAGSAGPAGVPAMAMLNGNPTAQRLLQSLQTNVQGVSFELRGGAQPSLRLAFRAPDPAKAQAFKTDFDAVRTEASAQFKALSALGMAGALGEGAGAVQSGLDGQSQSSGSEVTMDVPLAPRLFANAFANVPNPFGAVLQNTKSRRPQRGFGFPAGS